MDLSDLDLGQSIRYESVCNVPKTLVCNKKISIHISASITGVNETTLFFKRPPIEKGYTGNVNAIENFPRKRRNELLRSYSARIGYYFSPNTR